VKFRPALKKIQERFDECNLLKYMILILAKLVLAFYSADRQMKNIGSMNQNQVSIFGL